MYFLFNVPVMVYCIDLSIPTACVLMKYIIIIIIHFYYEYLHVIEYALDKV